jgi:hypothetical protein
VTRGRSAYGDAYWRGYERGVQSGHAAGYCEGLAVLADAADVLAGLGLSRTVGIAAARQRMRERSGPSLTPRQIRARAAASWGLPVPADLAEPTDLAEPADHTTGPPAAGQAAPADQPVAAELADDDDWAWRL